MSKLALVHFALRGSTSSLKLRRPASLDLRLLSVIRNNSSKSSPSPNGLQSESDMPAFLTQIKGILNDSLQPINNRLNDIERNTNKQFDVLSRQIGAINESAARSSVSKRLGDYYVQPLLVTNFENLLRPFYGEDDLPVAPSISDLSKALKRIEKKLSKKVQLLI